MLLYIVQEITLHCVYVMIIVLCSPPPQGIYQMFGIMADVAVIGMLVYIIQRYVFTIMRIVYGGDIHYHCTPKEDVGLTYT